MHTCKIIERNNNSTYNTYLPFLLYFLNCNLSFKFMGVPWKGDNTNQQVKKYVKVKYVTLTSM